MQITIKIDKSTSNFSFHLLTSFENISLYTAIIITLNSHTHKIAQRREKKWSQLKSKVPRFFWNQVVINLEWIMII